MPDAFFSKPRPFSKRKREGEGEGGQRSGKSTSRNGTSSRGARGGSSSRGRGRGNGRRDGGGDRNDNKGKRRQEEEDEELDLPDDGAFDSDDMGSQDNVAAAEESSEEEDELETPAQKRLRLSQMYLKSLEKDKEGTFYLAPLPEPALVDVAINIQKRLGSTPQIWIGISSRNDYNRMS